MDQQLIRDSFSLIDNKPEEFSERFYDNLFNLRPEFRRMFSGDMDEQGKKLYDMLSVVVSNLDRLDTVLPSVKKLGKKHAEYGVTDDQYPIVGRVLIETINEFLPIDYPRGSDVLIAWDEAYNTLADVMIEAARKHREAGYPQ